MNQSARRRSLLAIALLLPAITWWNWWRGAQGASFGFYYIPIFGAALLWGIPGALAVATLSALGAAWTTLWRDGQWSLSAFALRPDLGLDVPLYFVFAVLVAALAHRHGAVDNLARTDPLTGVLNRPYLLESLAQQLQQARHDDQPLSLLLINIDHFARLNEIHGRERCDEALRAIGAAVRRSIRAVDVPGRTKGKEFGVILPETPLPGALLVAERIRKAVQEFGDLSGIYVTVCIGVVDIDLDENHEPVRFLAQADEALFEARRTGRNRILAFDPEMHHGVR